MDALELSFGLPEVRRWANFSGDFNPIHFDRDSADTAGLTDLVVHGMLVLLPIKAALAQRAREEGLIETGWMRFNALFRHPVAHDEPTLLTLQPSRHGGIDFRLTGCPTDTERFRGSLNPAAEPAGAIAPNTGTPRPAHPLRREDAARFSRSYPDVDEGWLQLDAVVFSDFMRSRLDDVARAAQEHLQKMARPRGPTDLLFVQASHTVLFDAAALAAPGPLPMPWEQLDCDMSQPEVIANPDKVIGSVGLSVRHAGCPVMRVEIGLLARPNIRNS